MDNQGKLTMACQTVGAPAAKLIGAVGLRWTVESKDPDFYKFMIKVEKTVQYLMGKPIDLRLESQEDKNKREKRNVLWTKPPTSTKD